MLPAQTDRFDRFAPETCRLHQIFDAAGMIAGQGPHYIHDLSAARSED
jgi:hypothetical protein